jgi:hypothetical protein
MIHGFYWGAVKEKTVKNYSSKKEDSEEGEQVEDERKVSL